MTTVDPAAAKHPDAMAPLLRQIDELLGLTRAAGRADLTARLSMSPYGRAGSSARNGMSTASSRTFVHSRMSTPGSDPSPVIIEIVINVLTFLLGAVIISYVWGQRRWFLGE